VHFIKRGWLDSNSFLFVGEQNLLVDTGYESGAADLRSRLNSHQVDFADLTLVINSHYHSDHLGGNRAIREHSDAPFMMHAYESRFVTGNDRDRTWLNYTDQSATLLPVDRPAQEGEKLSINGLTLRVIVASGHSPAGLCLFCEEERFLITGDALWVGDVSPIAPSVEGGLAALNAKVSLDKLEQLGARTLYPGHGEITDDVPANFHRVRQKLDSLISDPKRLAWHSFKQIFLFTLLMKDGISETALLPYLRTVPWFPDFCRTYLDMEQVNALDRLLDELKRKGLVRLEDGVWRAKLPR
jgi:glyoxylase-like metal-dependent hydrolase (beta-lactamase superfamily II)